MHVLDNPLQNYDWGTVDQIPKFTGHEPDGEPVAEQWMGTHPLAPSTITGADGSTVPLSAISGELPFLMKLLSASRPLSLQVHPSRPIAQEGFARENAAAIPLDAPNRTFKDPNHKPEMVYALTTFDTVVGFRPTAEILRVLAPIDTPLSRRLAEDLRARPGFAGIVRLVEDLLTTKPTADEISDVLGACRDLIDQGFDIKRAYATAVMIAEDYPADPGVIISLLLNRLTLQPGEAAFLGTGVIHAHLRGLCIEVMATSDNVLRAGLTSKHLDTEGLVRCLDGGMSRLARVEPKHAGTSTDVFTPGVEDFALSLTQVSNAEVDGVQLPAAWDRIIVCTGGEVELAAGAQRVKLKRGTAVYAGAEDGPLTVLGTGEVAQAYAPGTITSSTLVDLV